MYKRYTIYMHTCGICIIIEKYRLQIIMEDFNICMLYCKEEIYALNGCINVYNIYVACASHPIVRDAACSNNND